MACSPSTPPAADLPAQVLDTIRRHALLREGERVLVAVSGGADSLALLDCLIRLRPRLGLVLHVAHVHHGLRAEADAEAEAVRAHAEACRVPVSIDRVEVRGRGAGRAARPPWAGPEGEARRVRLAALAARARALGMDRIALGHTADDQAETVVMRLLQGAGPLGLGGIPPARGPFVRPLIETRRAAVEAHLRAAGIGWAEDASNRDPAFLRSRIRHEVLPFLADRWDPGAVEALCRGAATARAAAADLAARAAGALDRHATPEAGGLRLDARGLAALPAELAAEALRLAVIRVAPDRVLRGPARRALARLLADGTRRRVRLGAADVERSGRWLRVASAPPEPLRERRWRPPGELELPEVGLVLAARRVAREAGWRPPREADRVAFDAAALPETLLVRPRRPGDRLVPFGGPGARRLEGVLAAAGVPHWARARLPVLDAGGEILWVAGLRRGGAAPVTEATACILEVTVAVR